MKYLILPFIILLSSCRLESNVSTEYKEPPETVEEYCEDYSQKSTGNKLKIKQLCIDYKLYNTSK